MNVRKAPNDSSPRRTPGSSCLIWPGSDVRRNDGAELFGASLAGKAARAKMH